MKTTEHFKLQMWVPAHNIMCHFLHLPAQHWHYPFYTNCSAEGQSGICCRGGFPDRSLNFQSHNHKLIFPIPSGILCLERLDLK